MLLLLIIIACVLFFGEGGFFLVGLRYFLGRTYNKKFAAFSREPFEQLSGSFTIISSSSPLLVVDRKEEEEKKQEYEGGVAREET